MSADDRPQLTRRQLAVCALVAAAGGVVAIACFAVAATPPLAAACGLAASWMGAYLLTRARALRGAPLAQVLGCTFAFAVAEWPFLALLALVLFTSPGDWG